MGNLLGRLLLASSMILVLLTACASSSSKGDQDPKEVKVELITDPAQVHSGVETKLQVTITGLVDEENTEVQFEIRNPDNKSLPDLIQEVETRGKDNLQLRMYLRKQRSTMCTSIYTIKIFI